jgi:hypothetical protein
MFIVWGSKLRYPKIGYAADFCPICRDFREFRVHETREVSHVYYVPLGKGKLVGFRLDCPDCGVQLFQDELAIEDTIPSPSSSIDESISVTNPTIKEEYAKRMAIEKELASGALPEDPEIRSALLFEPFEALAPEMARGSAETRIDLPGSLGCLGTIVAAILAGFATPFLAKTFGGGPAAEETVIFVILGVGLVGTVYTFWQLHLSARRWLEKRIIPKINRALAPLRPTTAEIEEIIAVYQTHGLSFAKFLRIQSFEPIDGGEISTTPVSAKPLVPE